MQHLLLLCIGASCRIDALCLPSPCRHIPDLKPKHLFSGKRPRGTTDRR